MLSMGPARVPRENSRMDRSKSGIVGYSLEVSSHMCQGLNSHYILPYNRRWS